MTRDQFKKVLDKNGYKWREEELIIVEGPAEVDLIYLETIPDNVRFDNRGYVNLPLLESMGNNIKFNNRDDVYLESLESMGNNIKFNNGDDVNLGSLKSMGNNIQFNNGGNVLLNSLKLIPITEDIDQMFSKCVDIKIDNKWLDLEIGITFPDSRWKSVDGKVKMYESWVKNNY